MTVSISIFAFNNIWYHTPFPIKRYWCSSAPWRGEEKRWYEIHALLKNSNSHRECLDVFEEYSGHTTCSPSHLNYDLFVYQYVVQMNKRHDQIIYYVGAPFAEIGIPLRQGKDNVGSVFEQYKDGISLHMRHPSPRVLLEDHFNYWLAVIIALFAIYHLHSFNRQSTLGRCILLLVLVACGMLWTVCSDRLSIPLLFASCL